MDLYERLRELPAGERVPLKKIAETTGTLEYNLEMEIRDILREHPALGNLNSFTGEFIRAGTGEKTAVIAPPPQELTYSIPQVIITAVDNDIVPDALNKRIRLQSTPNSVSLTFGLNIAKKIVGIVGISQLVVGLILLITSVEPITGTVFTLVGGGLLVVGFKFMGRASRAISIDLEYKHVVANGIDFAPNEIRGIQIVQWTGGIISRVSVGAPYGVLYGLILQGAENQTTLFRIASNNLEKMILMGVYMGEFLTKYTDREVKLNPTPIPGSTPERIMALFNVL